MSRPRTEPRDRITTNVRLPRELYAELHDAAEDREVSANRIIVAAIRAWLDAHREVSHV